MSFWQFLTNLFTWFSDRTSRILATVQGTLAVLVGSSVIPENQLKYYVALIAVLQFWRAQAITNTVTAAKTIIANQSPTPTQIANTELPKNVNA